MIRLDQLSKSYGSKVILSQANFQFPTSERIALVGPNGVGKSTILNIIAGIEEADSGIIQIPNQCRLGYLPQEPNPTPESTVLKECQMGRDDLVYISQKMHERLTSFESNHDQKILEEYESLEAKFNTAGGYALESQAAGILYGLGFNKDQMQQSPLDLSGGWRMRLELGKLFLKNADFLILDEPTNHLDLPSLMWVEDYLKKYRGTLLLVSHDRALLNRIPTQILYLNRGDLKCYKGNFDQFLEAREQQQSFEESASEQLRKKREQLEGFVTRFGAKATKAKQAGSKLKQIAKIEEQEKELQNDYSEASISFNLPIGKPGPKVPMEFEEGDIGYEHVLSKGVNIKAERGQKIAIIGANGIGKSTLIKTIAGKIPAIKGNVDIADGVELSYFSQDQLDTLNPEGDVLTNLQNFSDIGTNEARNLLGSFLFLGEDVFKQVKVLSGGEKGRLGLACVMSQKSNFLLLDEPTNHLDLLSVETLTNAIQQYQGTVIFVSHDREFINDTCTHVFAMIADGRSRLFEGDLKDYERLAPVGQFPNVLDPVIMKETEKKPDASSSSEKSKEQSHDNYKILIKDLRKVEKQIKTLDASMEQCRQAIKSADEILLTIDPNNFEKANEHYQIKQKNENDLSELEEQWMELSEQEEGILGQLDAMGRLPKK